MLPHWGDLCVPQEDSLGWETFTHAHHDRADVLTIGVADLPAMSNCTDLEALCREPDVRLVRVSGAIRESLDALIFPGTKNTPTALQFTKGRGLDAVARRVAAEGGTVIGLCGGYQILGKSIRDPRGLESSERELEGLGLLDVVTTFARKKVLIQVMGVHRESGCAVEGYQIHMGRTRVGRDVIPFLDVEKPDHSQRWSEGAVSADGRVMGTYVHGLFDAAAFRRMWLNRLRARRGWPPLDTLTERTPDQALDDLADFVEQHVDMSAIQRVVEEGVGQG